MADLIGKLIFVQPQVGPVLFDLNLGEQHNFDNIITSHKIEDGSDITDHIKNQLRAGTLTGFISNYSLSTFIPPAAKNRIKDVYEALKAFWEEETTGDIVTYFETYKNVAISNISVGSPDNGTAARYQVSFREIKTVKLKEQVITADIRPGALNNPNAKQASPITNVGQQTGVPQ
jgi:hypothetical protein